MSIDDSFDSIYRTERKSKKELMDAKYPKKKTPYDVCLNCGFKLHSSEKNCPNCGKPMEFYSQEDKEDFQRQEKKKSFVEKLKSILPK